MQTKLVVYNALFNKVQSILFARRSLCWKQKTTQGSYLEKA